MAAASARIEETKSSWFSRARLLDFLEGVVDRHAHRVEVLGEVRDLGRARDLDLVPYSPCATARVESASCVIGLESRRAKSNPSRSAPARHTALQTTVSRTMRSTDANARFRSRSTSTPQGGSSDRGDRREHAARRRRFRARQSRRESGRSRPPGSRDAGGLAPGRGRKEDPAAPVHERRAHFPPGLVLELLDDRLPTTPAPRRRRSAAPFASITGVASTATVPSSGTPEGLAGVADAVPRRLEALPELEVHLRRMEVGPDEAPLPSRLTARRATSGVLPWSTPPRISAPSVEPKGSLPVSCTASRIASPALVSCCAAAP